MNPYRLRAYIYLIIVELIWGIASCVIKFTLKELPPFSFLAYRFFLSALVLVPILIASNKKLPRYDKSFWLLILAGFLATTVNLGLLFWGLSLTTVLDESLISITAPILIIIAGAIYLREHVTKKEKLGVAITLAGALTIIIQPLLESKILATDNILGNLLIFLSALSWVAYVIISKKALKEKVHPLVITVISFVVGLITIIPLALWEAGSPVKFASSITSLSLNGHLGVIYMALVSGALGYFLFSLGQKTIEASEATVFSYLKPLFAVPLAIIWLGEKITLPFVVGSIIITIGVAIAEIKRARLASPQG